MVMKDPPVLRRAMIRRSHDRKARVPTSCTGVLSAEHAKTLML
jgi:hypothetical protein